jgi:hypothetical protein
MPGGAGAGGGKVNFGAMQAQLQKNMKQAQMRERLMKKVQEKNGGGTGQTVSSPTTSVFRTGDKCEKTPRFPPAAQSAASASAAEARMLAAENQNSSKSKDNTKDKPKDKQE